MNCLKRMMPLLVFMMLFAMPTPGLAQKEIYKSMSIIDPGDTSGEWSDMERFAMFMGSMGNTSITDIGGGIYYLKITCGQDVLTSDFLSEAKVVGNDKVTFKYKASTGKMYTITMTPKELNLAGKLKLILIDKDAFQGLVKALGGVAGKSGGDSSSKSQASKQSKQQSSVSKYYKDKSLIQKFDGPMGIMPADPAMADYEQWNAAIEKSGYRYEKRFATGSIWFDFKGKPTSLVSYPSICYMKLNIRHYNIVYRVQVTDRKEALKVFEDLTQMLRASGFTLTARDASGSYLKRETGQLDGGDFSVSLNDFGSGKFDITLSITRYRKYQPSDYEIVLPVTMSYGENLFGVAGLVVDAPLEKIKEEFRKTLSPGVMTDSHISTNEETGHRTLLLPLDGVDKARGLKSTSLGLDDCGSYRRAVASMGIWYENDSERFSINKPKMRTNLYGKLIERLRQEYKGLRKGSAKDLAPYGNWAKVKEVWVMDHGHYRDYYVLWNNDDKTISIISLYDK